MATARSRARFLRLVLLALLLAGAAVLAWWLLRPPAAAAVAVREAPLVRTLQFSARMAADSRVEVGSTITGRVEKVLVREGDTVTPGQLLVQLEAGELRAAWQQARASEQQAQARLAGLRSTGRAGAQAALDQAEAQLRNAQAELHRREQLVAQGFVSGSQLDEARRALDVAKAQREAARAQTRASGERGTDILQAQAQLALAQAATEAAAARLAQTHIVAPAAARVLTRLVEPGQIVQAGKPLLGLALDSPRELVAEVDERFLEQLRVGQPALAVADAYPGQPFSARVRSLAPVIDPQRGAIEVKLAVPDPPPFLREDITVSVEVETGRRGKALVVPLAALRTPDTVWLAQDGRVQSRRVRLGLRTLDAVEVVDGLAAGDQVLLGAAPNPGKRVRAQLQPWTPGAEQVPGGGGGDAMGAVSSTMGR